MLWQVHCKEVGMRRVAKAEHFPLLYLLPCVVWSLESSIWHGAAHETEFQSSACVFCDSVNLHLQSLSEQLL